MHLQKFHKQKQGSILRYDASFTLAVHGQICKKSAKNPQNQMPVDKRKKRSHLWKYTYQIDIFILFHTLFLSTSQKLLNIFKMYWTLTFDALIWQKNVRKKRPIVFPYKIWRRKTVFTWEFQESKLLFSWKRADGSAPFPHGGNGGPLKQ